MQSLWGLWLSLSTLAERLVPSIQLPQELWYSAALAIVALTPPEPFLFLECNTILSNGLSWGQWFPFAHERLKTSSFRSRVLLILS